jgi:serine/threonine protein kinase
VHAQAVVDSLNSILSHGFPRYKVVKQLGDGTYGNVWKAINRQTDEVVRAAFFRMAPKQCNTV